MKTIEAIRSKIAELGSLTAQHTVTNPALAERFFLAAQVLSWVDGYVDPAQYVALHSNKSMLESLLR